MSAEVSPMSAMPPAGVTPRANVGVNVDLYDLVDEGMAVEPAFEARDSDDEDEAGLTDRWAALQERAEDLHRVRSLQREMLHLKDELLALAARVAAAVEMDRQVDDMQQLQERINSVKADLESLRNRKPSILQLNVDVHRYTTDTRQQHPAAVLKSEIADLYRVWDDTYQGVSEQLEALQRIAETWQQFEQHLAELQSALLSDRQTLQLLEGALQLEGGGRPPPAVVGCVRDVARALSEGQTDTAIGQSALDVLAGAQTAALCHTEGGSLSDSGISDTGSDQEPSEREKRLANLRRLVRQLEAVLSPGSRALENMTERIRETENKLRGLQKTCRNLIVRTAVREAVSLLPNAPQGAPAPADSKGVTSPLPSRRTSNGIRSKRSGSGSLRRRRDPDGDPDDPDSGSGKALSRHWLWRVVRASLPCHLGIVLILCVACLLEPHCCDAINNLNLSLSPQLRYIRGPPPV